MAAEVDPMLYEHLDDSPTEADSLAAQKYRKCTDSNTPDLREKPHTPHPKLNRESAKVHFELPEEIPDSQESLDLSDTPTESGDNSFQTEETVVLTQGTQITLKPQPKYTLHRKGILCNGRLPIEDPIYDYKEEMEEEATQPSTQPFFDPRRVGRNNSGLTTDDESDVICILHPGSNAALRAVALVAQSSPQHILQNEGLEMNMEEIDDNELIFDNDGTTRDIALRMSSRVKDPCMGFCFGRNPGKCDFIIGNLAEQKRISNMHFRIYVNKDGIIMLQDMSTNGTVVDDVLLRGKDGDANAAKTRMLAQGSILQLITSYPEEEIKFIVRIPARDDDRGEYAKRLSAYLASVAQAERSALVEVKAKGDFSALPNAVVPPRRDAATPPNVNSAALIASGTSQYHFGMHWNGGENYNVVGYIGKGAFAMVYKLATKRDGEVFAVKQLEKRKFMKNGILDHKVNNELKIIKHLRHPNIVQYIHYADQPSYLYIIMEYVACGELSSYMSQNGPMPELLAKSVSRQILHALDYLHKRKITHRDIKPDNILIASNDPFIVKLSDFGLSKVVNDMETFLKTFCGTLLYCAPEVYPDYDLYKSGLPNKKRRRASDPPPQTLPYNQSIDIWSLAAVLFHLISGKPPYVGSSEGKGARMLASIMTTPLDIGPLKECGVSHNCINLIVKMLNPHPLLRPDEQECLRHPWLLDSASAGEMDLDDNNVGLEAIQEEDEAALGASHQMDSGDACDVAESDVSEVIEVDEIDHEDTRQSKRAKIDAAFAPRDQTQLSSSPEVLYPSLPATGTDEKSNEIHTGSASHNTRLFGEIGASALRSSGVLGYDAQAALQISTQSNRDERASASNSTSGHHLRIATACNINQRQATNDDLGQHQLQYPHPLSLPDTQAGPAPSLLGAEALVGQLNMASPESAKSAFSAPNTPKTPTTPKTREPSPISALAGSKRSSQEANNESAEITPKRRPKFENFADRMIRFDLPPSYYFGRHSSTHNLEYASAVSGRDYLGEAKAAYAVLQAEQNGEKSTERITRRPDGTIPWTMSKGWEKEVCVQKALFGDQAGDKKKKSPAVENKPTSKATSTADVKGNTLTTQNKEFVKPPPRLGKLTSMPGSFVDLTLRIDQRSTRWGRAFDSTIVYTQNMDTRVPKNAVDIMFWGPGMDSRIKEGRDWMDEENSWAVISTRTSLFIRVNGVMLKRLAPDGSGMLYGKLYTGDIITIFEDDKEFLKFKCDFFHSKSAGPRPANEKPFVVEKETEKFLAHLKKSTELAAASAAASAAFSGAAPVTASAPGAASASASKKA